MSLSVVAGAFAADDIVVPDRAELDMALEAPIINTNPGPEYADENRHFALTTGLAQTPGGRLWSAWFSGGDTDEGFLLLATSDDKGLTWSKPRVVIDPTEGPNLNRRTLVGNLWTDPDGRLWLIFDQSMGYFDGRAGVWLSVCDNPDADNPVWSKPRRIADGATLNKPTVLENGDWILPVSLWDTGKISTHAPNNKRMKNMFPELDDQRKAWVYRSRDKGESWERLGGVYFPGQQFDEHMIVERRDGSLWMLARIWNGISQSFSKDGGVTWSKPEPAAIANAMGVRFFIRRLASGNLLLVKNGEVIDEPLQKRTHLSAFLSRDDGKTWEGSLLLDSGNGEQVTYPDGFQDEDGMIYIQYDYGRVLAAEIRLARFTEEDILAGKFQSAGSKEKILINKATGRKPWERAPKGAHELLDSKPKQGDIMQPAKVLTNAGADYALATRKHQGVPTVAQSEGGRLWAAWYGGPGGYDHPSHYVVLSTSEDGGLTWKDGVLVIDPDGADAVRAINPQLWVDPKGTLWLFWAQVMRGGATPSLWAVKTDNPNAAQPVWSEPQLVGSGVMTRKPVALSGGEWALPVSSWRGKQPSAGMIGSADGGKSWQAKGGATVSQALRDFDEHSIVELGDGSLMMLVRVRPVPGSEQSAPRGIGRSISKDGGKTWTDVERTDIPHVMSGFYLGRLGSGELLLVKHADDVANRTNLTAYLSDDDGKTWTGGLLLERRWCSYPDAFEGEDGNIFVIYDRDRLKGTVSMAVITAEDIRAGRLVSPQSRLALPVSAIPE